MNKTGKELFMTTESFSIKKMVKTVIALSCILMLAGCDLLLELIGKTSGDRNAVTYTLVFDKNHADATGDMASQTGTPGDVQNLPLNSFVRTSCRFTGWNTEANGSGASYANGASVTGLADTAGVTVTLYAQWRRVLTSTAEIGGYLDDATGGATSDDPVYLELDLELTQANWEDILTAIADAGDYILLDLTDCDSPGMFDPLRTVPTGKDKIISIILPTQAESIDGVGHPSQALFSHFTGLESITGMGITSIGRSAFEDCNTLASVNFPLVASIGQSAFTGCTALTSVDMPNALYIGYHAFSRCTSLTSISLPEARSIGAGAFFNNGLTSIDLPKVLSIDYEAFTNCTVLASISIPSVQSIGSEAFYGCSGLGSVTLGEPATSLGSYLFSGTTSAQTITVHIPESARDAYGLSGLPNINFDNANTTANNWGNAFRGGAWYESNMQASGAVSVNISLVFETY